MTARTFSGFSCRRTSGRTRCGPFRESWRQRLLRLSGAETRVVGSGRTDAGVHAAGQVVGFRAEWRHGTNDLHRALNAVLPADVAVVDLDEAPEEWHPRFSAQWRHYRYTVRTEAWRSPLTRRYMLHVAQPLSLPGMQSAAQVFVGQHDFASFGRPMQDGETTMRIIYRSGWHQEGETLAPGALLRRDRKRLPAGDGAGAGRQHVERRAGPHDGGAARRGAGSERSQPGGPARGGVRLVPDAC